ncbi:MAG: hypothetical protein K6F27_12235 [Ruminococcus sp.]|nr:hypothetical protein [Ruminococcus sp.]
MTDLKSGNSGSLKEPSSYTARQAEGSLVQQGCSEHEVYKNVLEAFEMYGKKRDNYRKYGTLFIILSAIGILALMFGLESKITFLILWVITDYICAALMIRAEYRYHEFAVLLGYKETDDEEDDTAEIEGEQKSPDTADNSGQEEQNTVTNADRADKQEE